MIVLSCLFLFVFHLTKRIWENSRKMRALRKSFHSVEWKNTKWNFSIFWKSKLTSFSWAPNLNQRGREKFDPCVITFFYILKIYIYVYIYIIYTCIYILIHWNFFLFLEHNLKDFIDEFSFKKYLKLFSHKNN